MTPSTMSANDNTIVVCREQQMCLRVCFVGNDGRMKEKYIDVDTFRKINDTPPELLPFVEHAMLMSKIWEKIWL
jgi:hypothetical protein